MAQVLSSNGPTAAATKAEVEYSVKLNKFRLPARTNDDSKIRDQRWLLKDAKFHDVVITVGFGRERMAFRLHRAVLASSSTFLRARFQNAILASSATAEAGQPLEMTLEEIRHPEAFFEVIQWMYGGPLSNLQEYMSDFDRASLVLPITTYLELKNLRPHGISHALSLIDSMIITVKPDNPKELERAQDDAVGDLNALYRLVGHGDCDGFKEVGISILKNMTTKLFLDIFQTNVWMDEKMKRDFPGMMDSYRLQK